MKEVRRARGELGAAFVVIMVFTVFSLVSCDFQPEKSITIRGSTTVLPIAQSAAEVFMDRHRDVDISVQGGGSGVGIASIIEGTTDIATSSRAIKENELKTARSNGVNLKAHTVAMDGIAVIVHPSNPVKEISKEQLRSIYAGTIANWSEVGGKKEKIVVVSRDVASGTFEAFNELALDNKRVRPGALMQASNQAVAATVGITAGAVGYVGLGYLSPKVKALSVGGVMPTKETVLSGEYALARPLYMYTRGEPRGVVREFIDFVLSAEGQKLVAELGFVPVH